MLKMASALSLSDWVAFVGEQEKELYDKVNSVKHYQMECQSDDDKYIAVTTLYELLGSGFAVVFCKANYVAENLMKNLNSGGYSSSLLTPDKTLSEADAIRLFITTDRWAKEVEVKQTAAFVVNYDLPVDERNQADCETYMHRLKFADKKEEKGKVVNLVHGFKAKTIWSMIQDNLRFSFLSVELENMPSICQSYQPIA